jgi:hypothetical protein
VDQSPYYDSQFSAANSNAHDRTGNRHSDCHPHFKRHCNTNRHSDAYRHADGNFDAHRYSHSHADEHALRRVPPCIPL